MIMFQMGPFLWSCRMKLNITVRDRTVLLLGSAKFSSLQLLWVTYLYVLNALLIAQRCVFLTSKTHKKAEEYRIEEAKADCKNVLMDHGGHGEHKQHGHWSETLLRHLE